MYSRDNDFFLGVHGVASALAVYELNAARARRRSGCVENNALYVHARGDREVRPGENTVCQIRRFRGDTPAVLVNVGGLTQKQYI